MSHIFLNDFTYSADEEDPHRSLEDALAFAADDWGDSRAKSWVYGIILGWDNDDGTPGEAMDEQAQRHGWSDETVARLRRLHAVWKSSHPERHADSEEEQE